MDISLILKTISPLLYFAYYPYEEGEGNCSEIFVGRLSKCFIMVEEMHQIYLLAHVLGMSFIPRWMSLETALNILSVLVIVTIFLSYQSAETQIYVRPFRHLWSLIVSLIQINIISTARRVPSQKERDIISHNDATILMFEKLSILQLTPTVFLVAYSFYGESQSFLLQLTWKVWC